MRFQVEPFILSRYVFIDISSWLLAYHLCYHCLCITSTFPPFKAWPAQNAASRTSVKYPFFYGQVTSIAYHPTSDIAQRLLYGTPRASITSFHEVVIRIERFSPERTHILYSNLLPGAEVSAERLDNITTSDSHVWNICKMAHGLICTIAVYSRSHLKESFSVADVAVRSATVGVEQSSTV